MLGPSVILASVPAAFLYALSVALVPSKVPRPLAIVALALCGLELLLLIVAMIG